MSGANKDILTNYDIQPLSDEQKHRARLVCAANGRDPDEIRMFLDMLGLRDGKR